MNKDRNVLVLAYLGDAIYELYVREYLIRNNIVKVNLLQKEAIKYVSAKAQAKIINNLIEKNILNDEELEIFYRARNHKGTRHPKNTDIITYKHSTGFEAIIGYLYLQDKERLDKIINIILED